MSTKIAKKPTAKAHAISKKRATKFGGVAGKVGGLAVSAAALFGGFGNHNEANADVFMGDPAATKTIPKGEVLSENMQRVFNVREAQGPSGLLTAQLVLDFQHVYQNQDSKVAADAVGSVYKVADEVIKPFADVLKDNYIQEKILINSRRLNSNAVDIGRVFGYGDDYMALFQQLSTPEGRQQFEKSGAVKAALAARILKRWQSDYPEQAPQMAQQVWNKMCGEDWFPNVDVKTLNQVQLTPEEAKYPTGKSWGQTFKEGKDRFVSLFSGPVEEDTSMRPLSAMAKIVMALQLQPYAKEANCSAPYRFNKEDGADKALWRSAEALLNLESKTVVVPLSDKKVYDDRAHQRMAQVGTRVATGASPKGSQKEINN